MNKKAAKALGYMLASDALYKEFTNPSDMLFGILDDYGYDSKDADMDQIYTELGKISIRITKIAVRMCDRLKRNED
jgi:hypothetical protein